MDCINQATVIFFDLFGTLIIFNDFDGAQQSWVRSFHDLVGKKNGVSLDEIRVICSEILGTEVKKDGAASLTTYETKIKTTFSRHRISISRNELRGIADSSLGVWQDHSEIAEDASHVLTVLKRHAQIGLITNFDHSPHVRKLIADAGLENVFDSVLISDEVGFSKPRPEIFTIALDSLKSRAQDAVHVGDSITDDICGAQSVNIRSILIDRGVKSHDKYEREKGTDPLDCAVIRRLSDLIS